MSLLDFYKNETVSESQTETISTNRSVSAIETETEINNIGSVSNIHGTEIYYIKPLVSGGKLWAINIASNLIRRQAPNEFIKSERTIIDVLEDEIAINLFGDINRNNTFKKKVMYYIKEYLKESNIASIMNNEYMTQSQFDLKKWLEFQGLYFIGYCQYWKDDNSITLFISKKEQYNKSVFINHYCTIINSRIMSYHSLFKSYSYNIELIL